MTVAVVVELLRASALLVFALTSLALDGKSNWPEGAVLFGVCAFAALALPSYSSSRRSSRPRWITLLSSPGRRS